MTRTSKPLKLSSFDNPKIDYTWIPSHVGGKPDPRSVRTLLGEFKSSPEEQNNNSSFFNFSFVEYSSESVLYHMPMRVSRRNKQLLEFVQSLKSGDGITVEGFLNTDTKNGARTYYSALRVDRAQEEGRYQQSLEESERVIADYNENKTEKKELNFKGRPQITVLTPHKSKGKGDFISSLKHRVYKSGAVRERINAISYHHVTTAGSNAVNSLVDAIKAHSTEGSLIILTRGGGSWSDLAAFDHPEVVKALTESPAHIWTAIGHSNDAVLADHVADETFDVPAAAGNALRCALFEAYRRKERPVDQFPQSPPRIHASENEEPISDKQIEEDHAETAVPDPVDKEPNETQLRIADAAWLGNLPEDTPTQTRPQPIMEKTEFVMAPTVQTSLVQRSATPVTICAALVFTLAALTAAVSAELGAMFISIAALALCIFHLLIKQDSSHSDT